MIATLNYIQMPLYSFLQQFPDLRSTFPYSLFSDFRYVVRVQLSTGTVEVGFPEDDWEIN